MSIYCAILTHTDSNNCNYNSDYTYETALKLSTGLIPNNRILLIMKFSKQVSISLNQSQMAPELLVVCY